MENFSSAKALVEALKPQEPVSCLRPHASYAAGNYFLRNFCGKTLYAVKTNPHPCILRALRKSGITRFDVASLNEIALLNRYIPDSEINFLHPVKNKIAISKAYYDYNVRTFAFDSISEMQKISDSTNRSNELTMLLRLSVSNRYSAHSLTGKFGVGTDVALNLLPQAAKYCQRLGICFHVGSQCLEPKAYKLALRTVERVLQRTNVSIDIIDVGGGFPSMYPGQNPTPLSAYFAQINTSLAEISLPKHCEVWCEPGRALAAEAGSTIVHVDARKNNLLYINDGTYGGLFDAGLLGFRYPVKCLSIKRPSEDQPFIFYGPTCDSLDVMPGPFMLPSNISEGDYIEIGLTGAYGSSLRTNFNGFDTGQEAILKDQPMISMYNSAEDYKSASNLA